MTFEKWFEEQGWAEEHRDVFRIVWDAATEFERDACAWLCSHAKPHGGRMWTDEQAACFDCLTHVEEAIRAR